MKNLKVGKKLLISFGTILVLFIISLVVAAVGILQNAQALDDFYDQPFNVVDTTWEMREATMAIERNIFWIVSSNDSKVVNQCKTDIETNVTIVDKGIKTLQQKFMGDKQLLEDYISMTDVSIVHQNTIVDLALKLTDEANQEALAMMESTYLPEMDKATEKLMAISEFAHNNAAKFNDNGTRIKEVSITLLGVLGVASLLISILLGLKVTKGITVPLSEVEHAAHELSKGNLKTEITYHSRDEVGAVANGVRETTTAMRIIIGDINYLLGEMAAGNFDVYSKAAENYVGEFSGILSALRHINSSLSDTLSQINLASEQVASGSDQVASGAQALSQGSTEQASSVEELAATINEISNQVRNNAESAQQASQLAGNVGNEMEVSNKKMQDMIRAMGNISDSSSEIGKIIKTIEDIAFQTNILALNAAVEAARAGAAGKGFAVVADEVRNLASKSAEASKNTSTLIETSLKAVEGGTHIADETANALLAAVDGVKQVTKTINQISEASNEQAQSIVQVTQGIDQISSVVQTNSATAEESAAASEELSGQAQVLKNLVGRFHLKDEDRNSQVSLPDRTESNPIMLDTDIY